MRPPYHGIHTYPPTSWNLILSRVGPTRTTRLFHASRSDFKRLSTGPDQKHSATDFNVTHTVHPTCGHHLRHLLGGSLRYRDYNARLRGNPLIRDHNGRLSGRHAGRNLNVDLKQSGAHDPRIRDGSVDAADTYRGEGL